MKPWRLDIYDVDLYAATDMRQWRALRRRLTFLDETPSGAGMSQFAVWEPANGLDRPVIVLFVDVARHDEPGLVNTCAHEASHAASQLFDHFGHHPSGTDEPTAYLVGWLTQWLWEACQRAKEKP